AILLGTWSLRWIAVEWRTLFPSWLELIQICSGLRLPCPAEGRLRAEMLRFRFLSRAFRRSLLLRWDWVASATSFGRGLATNHRDWRSIQFYSLNRREAAPAIRSSTRVQLLSPIPSWRRMNLESFWLNFYASFVPLP